MSKIYVSTGAFKTQDIDMILQICVSNGVHNLELSSGTHFAEGLLDLVRAHHGRPMQYLVHNYFPPHRDPFVLNLASTNAHGLKRSRDHCETRN